MPITSLGYFMNVKFLYHEQTGTYTYIVINSETQECIVIDPVLDFNLSSGSLSIKSLKQIKQLLNDKSLRLKAILETHVHADHMTGSQILKQWYPEAITAIGEHISEVQKIFAPYFAMEIPCNGGQFDHLLKDNEEWQIAGLKLKCLSTPGHTPACCCFLIEDNIFTGDTLFMPDFGTGRCDFPKGSADNLFNSVKEKLYMLPDSTKVYVGHDYGNSKRKPNNITSIGESKQSNKHLNKKTLKQEFVAFRTKRDASLNPPMLLYPSLQVNILAGETPIKLGDNNSSYLKWPLKWADNQEKIDSNTPVYLI